MRMRTAIAAGVATGAAALVLGAVALTASGPSKAVASSHREAPLIANDPTADLTDFYLFPSPEKAGTVTMIANVIPLEAPPEGPNYYNLDDSACYRFNIDWNGDGKAERTWTLRTKTTTAYPGTFLYNIGPVNSINDPNLSVRQTWTLWMVCCWPPWSEARIGGASRGHRDRGDRDRRRSLTAHCSICRRARTRCVVAARGVCPAGDRQ